MVRDNGPQKSILCASQVALQIRLIVCCELSRTQARCAKLMMRCVAVRRRSRYSLPPDLNRSDTYAPYRLVVFMFGIFHFFFHDSSPD